MEADRPAGLAVPSTADGTRVAATPGSAADAVLTGKNKPRPRVATMAMVVIMNFILNPPKKEWDDEVETTDAQG